MPPMLSVRLFNFGKKCPLEFLSSSIVAVSFQGVRVYCALSRILKFSGLPRRIQYISVYNNYPYSQLITKHNSFVLYRHVSTRVSHPQAMFRTTCVHKVTAPILGSQKFLLICYKNDI